MLKKLFVILCLMLLVTGCTPKFSDEVVESRTRLISSLGKTNDKQIVVLYKNKKGYYYEVYSINKKSYTKYRYMFFNKEDDYKKAKKEVDIIKSKLITYDDMLSFRVFVSEGNATTDNLKEELMKYIKKTKGYKIVE